MTLRAVDDSSNTLALVAALRSSIFGCGDDDLFAFHVEHGGPLGHRRPLPDGLAADDPVAAAMRFLARAARGARVVDAERAARTHRARAVR